MRRGWGYRGENGGGSRLRARLQSNPWLGRGKQLQRWTSENRRRLRSSSPSSPSRPSRSHLGHGSRPACLSHGNLRSLRSQRADE